jgi:hypothetical protein
LSNWSNVDAWANVHNLVIADTPGRVRGWNRPTFNLYVDQHSDIDIDTDVTQRNNGDDCSRTSHGRHRRYGSYDFDRMGNWSDVDVRANVRNAVIADTSGLVAGANKPRFNLYIDQHTGIDTNVYPTGVRMSVIRLPRSGDAITVLKSFLGDAIPDGSSAPFGRKRECDR